MLLPLNNIAKTVDPLRSIPIVQHFRYLGLNIFPSVTKIVSDNYITTLNTMLVDLVRWAVIPQSIQAQFSVINMNIMPRINFCSSMLAFPPPGGYWNRLHYAINRFTWINKPPRIKLATLQRARNLGGQIMPNLKYYFWSFTMKTLSSWLNPEVGNAWRPIEESRVKPHCLEDVVYPNMPNQNCLVKFGSISSNILLLLAWENSDFVIPSHCPFVYSITLDGKHIFPQLVRKRHSCSCRHHTR